MIVVLASLALLSVQPRRGTRTRDRAARFSDRSVEPDDHYPLTCTPQNGVWMLGNLNTCPFLLLPGSEAKNSNLMMFYEGKKSMSMISWSRKGTQAN